MLRDLISSNRETLISRTRGDIFLSQISETLRLETTATPFSPAAIGAAAATRGGELLAQGCSLSQVVHEYADVCQAITLLALEQGAPISAGEFHTLSRCLDAALAAAIAEFGRLQEEASSRRDLQRRGQIAHELRNVVQTALLSFRAVEAGKVGAGAAGRGVLGRSLVNIRDLVESIVSDVYLASSPRRRERVALIELVEELGVTASLHAEYRAIRLTVEPVDPALAVDVDIRLLASAAMNLVHNAFQYTRSGGQVTIRARAERGRVLIDVEDECGGLTAGNAEQVRPPGDRRGHRRSGLGLGLSLSRRAVAADGGEIHCRNLPGKGCVFSIELPLAADSIKAPHA